uniref:LYR motif-containing protein 4 n=1 Tax=Salmo salar TaxID=8030 RepID=B5X5E9_SALSA|nr:LYR motif-containing protein 4 [Salmo salar]
MAACSRTQVISLYRMLIKESKKFPSYNYRTYALRRVKDSFRENLHVDNPKLWICCSTRPERTLQSSGDRCSLAKCTLLRGPLWRKLECTGTSEFVVVVLLIVVIIGCLGPHFGQLVMFCYGNSTEERLYSQKGLPPDNISLMY